MYTSQLEDAVRDLLSNLGYETCVIRNYAGTFAFELTRNTCRLDRWCCATRALVCCNIARVS